MRGVSACFFFLSCDFITAYLYIGDYVVVRYRCIKEEGGAGMVQMVRMGRGVPVGTAAAVAIFFGYGVLSLHVNVLLGVGKVSER